MSDLETAVIDEVSADIKPEVTEEKTDSGTSDTTLSPEPEKVITEEVKPYTEDEYLQSLDTEEGPDKSRLSPTQSAAYTKIEQRVGRAADKGLTQKFQEIAELRLKYEQAIQQKTIEPPKPQEPNDILFQHYLNDPKGVMTAINDNIKQLAQIGQYDENFVAAQTRIAEFNAIKDEFRESREQKKTTEELTKAQTENKKNIELSVIAEYQKIPDLPQVFPVARDYAINTLKLIPEDVDNMINPHNFKDPMASVRFVKALYTVAKTLDAAKLQKGKPIPNLLNSAGESVGTKSGSDDVAPEDPTAYQAWYRKKFPSK